MRFNCAKCGQSIVIDAAGARQQVQCPNCGQRLTESPIPPPAVIGTKQCPFCAETIKQQAMVCRYCGYNLQTGQPSTASAPQVIPPSPNVVVKERGEGLFLQTMNLGCLIVIIIIVFLIIAFVRGCS